MKPSRFAACLAGASLACLALAAPSSAREVGKVPDLASTEFAWLAYGAHWFDPPPGLGHGPIRQDPAVPSTATRTAPGR